MTYSDVVCSAPDSMHPRLIPTDIPKAFLLVRR